MSAATVDTKRCTRCERELPRTAFARHKRSRDRLKYWCRDCTAAEAATYYASANGRTRVHASLKRNAPKHRDAINARKSVLRALQKGTLQRGPCEHAEVSPCRGPIQGHHDDYSKRLDVRWLCRRHHQELHHAPASLPLRGVVG